MTESLRRRVPSPGPRPYGDDLADCFFGRNTEIAMILDRVYGQRLSVLVAESASGKTSLLQAGVIPALRKARLRAIANEDSPLPQFGLLLNQWLGRASGAGRTDFVRLLTCEIDRYLKSCTAWYVSQSEPSLSLALQREIECIVSARTAVQETAAGLGLAVLDSTRDELLPVEPDGPAGDDDRSIMRNILTILPKLTERFGSVLLILDQFEEVLGDPVIGRQAIVTVETVFDNCRQDVRQFLSLRNDSIHLLEPLEKKSILEGKRRVSISKLAPPAVNEIVESMSQIAELPWSESADRERLVGTFTSPRPPKDVNLLGLQVVLADLFAQLIARDATKIDGNDLLAYCMTLKMPEGQLGRWLDAHLDANGEMRNGELAEVAPRQWIERCLAETLEARAAHEPEDLWLGQIKPMVARMADWLVTPAGFKRPMTIGELEKIAFRDDVQRNRQPAGAARDWSLSRLEQTLDRTCKAALGRLVHGHVLKERGGTSDKTYELVHDQFGRPLRQWAKTFAESPASDLASPFAVVDRPFQWSGVQLRKSVDGDRVADVAWIGCSVRGVDFSSLTLSNCDFSRTVFEGCTFSADTRLENCRLEGAILRGCKLQGTTFVSCQADSIRVDPSQDGRRSEIDGVAFKGGSLKSATFVRTILRDCEFSGSSAERLLPMRNLEIFDCDLRGEVTFRSCALDGATIGADPDSDLGKGSIPADDLTFIDCDLSGAEITNLRFDGSKLKVRGGFAHGVVFERVIVTETAFGDPRCVFDSVELTGGIFLGCELRNTEFRGAGIHRKTAASTLVFRHIESGDEVFPTILSDVTFRDLDLENFTFRRCRIEGAIEFTNCSLSGGTIEGSKSDGSHRLNGDIAFNADCDLAALELNTLDLTGQNLRILQSRAQGMFFSEVTITDAHFIQTDMQGAIFLGCHISGAHFSGSEGDLSSIESLVIRGLNKRPATLGNCLFDHVNMSNFTFESCVIDGDLTFDDCTLSGGTIGNATADDTPNSASMPINGSLIFNRGDLSALEITNVVFASGARLTCAGSTCRGALFDGTIFPSDGADGQPALLMNDVDLSGCVFAGCALPTASFSGGGQDAPLMPAWGLVFRGNHVGEVAFSQYDCDGASFETVDVQRRLSFEDCSLLRSKFSGITASYDGAMLDLSTSDILYAEIDDALLDSPSIAIRPELREASKSAASYRPRLRLTTRKQA